MSRGGHNGSLTEQYDGSTNPFSDSFIDRRLARVSDVNSSATELHPDGFVDASLEVDTDASQDVPINDLNLEGLSPSFRMLLQPAIEVNLRLATDTASAAWTTFKTLTGQHSVKCLAVSQDSSQPSVKIDSPLPMEFFFDSQSDSIEIRNRSTDTLLEFSSIEDDFEVPVAPFASDRLVPGFWTVSGFGKPAAFQLLVLPRELRLEVVKQSLGLLYDPAGSKRRFSARIKQKSLIKSGDSSTQLWDTVKPVKSLTEASAAQTIRVTSTDGTDFTVFRMSNAGPSSSADVFSARLSQFQGQLVVVKVLKPTPSAANRARNWAREFRIHEKLRSVSGLSSGVFRLWLTLPRTLLYSCTAATPVSTRCSLPTSTPRTSLTSPGASGAAS